MANPDRERGARPVSMDVARGQFVRPATSAAPRPAGRSQPPLPKRPKDALAAVAALTSPATLWVSSIDGGVGRSTVAIALAMVLQSRGGRCILVDCDPHPRSDLERRLGVRPSEQEPSAWMWSARTPSGVQAVTAARNVDLEPAADSFRSIVVDLPVGCHRSGPGIDVLVTRGDAHALDRVTRFLGDGDSGGITPIIIVNDAVTLSVSSRARALAKALEGRAAAVLHLRQDAGLDQSSTTVAGLAPTTQLVIAHAILNAIKN